MLFLDEVGEEVFTKRANRQAVHRNYSEIDAEVSTIMLQEELFDDYDYPSVYAVYQTRYHPSVA